MTTQGKARLDWRSQQLRELPERIARAEANGHPVVVELIPPVPEHTQRLYATLGCLVRFVPGGAA